LASDKQVGFPIALAHNWIAKDDLTGTDTEYLYTEPGMNREGQSLSRHHCVEQEPPHT